MASLRLTTKLLSSIHIETTADCSINQSIYWEKEIAEREREN